jgi:hypothetical protein
MAYAADPIITITERRLISLSIHRMQQVALRRKLYQTRYTRVVNQATGISVANKLSTRVGLFLAASTLLR